MEKLLAQYEAAVTTCENGAPSDLDCLNFDYFPDSDYDDDSANLSDLARAQDESAVVIKDDAQENY